MKVMMYNNLFEVGGNMKKIVITNAYTWFNKGDSGILLATVASLKKIYGEDIEINILSFTPEEDKKRYCQDKCIKDVYSNILNPHPYQPGKLGKFIAIIKLFFNMILLQLNLFFGRKKIVEKNKALNVLDKADIIIVCGGGFLGGKKFDSFMHLYQMYVNSIFNKPVYVMGTSIEPINNRVIKYFTDKVLKKMDFVFAREKITESYLSDVLPKNKFALIPDMAFMLEYEKINFEFLNKYKSNKIFGITVRNWNFPNSNNKSQSQDNYINSVVNMMINYIKKYDAIFVFIPQVTVSTGDDTLVARIVKQRLPKECEDHFIIRTDDWSPSQIKSLINQMDFFVGTRMHSNIFATSAFVPTTAIAYEKKTNGIMETVGLEDYIVEIDSITAEELISTIDLMIKNSKKIKKHLEESIPKIQNNIIEILIKNMKGTD